MSRPEATLLIDVSSASEDQLADEMARLRQELRESRTKAEQSRRGGGSGQVGAVGNNLAMTLGIFAGNDAIRTVSIIGSIIQSFRNAVVRQSEIRKAMEEADTARIASVKMEREVAKRRIDDARRELQEQREAIQQEISEIETLRAIGGVPEAGREAELIRQRDAIEAKDRRQREARALLRYAPEPESEGVPSRFSMVSGAIGEGLAGSAVAVSAAFVMLAGAVKSTYHSMDQLSRKVEQYNGEVALARANQDIQAQLIEMRRSAFVGPDMAEFVRAQTDMQKAFSEVEMKMERAQARAMKPLVEMATEWLEDVDVYVEDIVELLQTIAEFTVEQKDSVVAAIAGLLEWKNPAEILEIMKDERAARRADRAKKQIEGFDIFMQVLSDVALLGPAIKRPPVAKPGGGAII